MSDGKKNKKMRARTAAGKILEPNTADDALSKHRESWQELSFKYDEDIGEIRNARRFIANSLSRARLVPAIQLDPGEPPTPIERDGKVEDLPDGVLPQEAGVLHETLGRFQSPETPQGGLIADFATQLFLPGEGLLLGRVEDDGERWDVYSKYELKKEGDGERAKWILDSGPKDKPSWPVGDVSVSRFWNPAPKQKWRADSAMRSLVVECAELDLLTRAIHGAGLAQLNAGIFIYPEEASFPPAELDGDEGMDGNGATITADEFEEMLEKFIQAPIDNPASAASVTPLMIRAKSELVDKFKHIAMDRPFDQVAIELRHELIVRIANGLELPAEALTGRRELNHWTGFVITDETFRNYLMPKLEQICGSITRLFLRPQLVQAGVNEPGRFLVWYEEAGIVSHPNAMSDVTATFDRFGASYKALRNAANLNDDDAPDDAEIALRLSWGQRIGGGAGGGLPVQDGSSTEAGVVNPQEQKGGGPGEGQKPAPLPAPGTGYRGPRTFGTSRAQQRANRALAQLSMALYTTDRQLSSKLQAAADAAIRRAVERAGARAVSKVKHDPALRSIVAEIPAFHVCERLGRDNLDRLDLTDAKLVDDQTFVDLGRTWALHVGKAQQQILRRIASFDAFGRPPRGIGDTWTHRLSDVSDTGWASLHGAVIAHARGALYGEVPLLAAGAPVAPIVQRMRRQEALDREAAKRRADEIAMELGERDSTLDLAPSAVREATARAGGAEGNAFGGGTVFDQGGPVTGISDGPMAQDLLAENGIAVESFEWVVGEPDRPFEPHQALDGIEFFGWDDDQLATEGEDWLIDPESGTQTDFYRPGDHVGCQRAVVQTLNGDMLGDALLASVRPRGSAPATVAAMRGAGASYADITADTGGEA